jgi:enolase
MSTLIEDVIGREILDSRGNPTVEVDVFLDGGAVGTRSFRPAPRPGRTRPSSCATATTGRYGARAFWMPCVTSTRRSVPELLGIDATDQISVDRLLIDLDGTPNKSKLGANALLGVSLAGPRRRRVRRPAALPLPRRRRRAHAAGAAREHPQRRQARDRQHRLPGVHDRAGRGALFREALRWAAETFHALGKLLHDEGLTTTVGDEGGYAPSLGSNEDAIAAVLTAIERAGYAPGSRSRSPSTRPRPSSTATVATRSRRRTAR